MIGSAARQGLSLKRAQNVIAFLRSLLRARGLSAENIRMTPLGFGDAAPRADNATRQGRALNRRVAIEIIRARAV